MTTPETKGDAAEAAQQFLDQAVREAKEARAGYEYRGKARFYLAAVLKLIAVSGGLIVATFDVNKVVLGVIISAAIIFDQVFSNYKRMMTETVAGAAVDRTVRRVETNYNDQVLDVMRARDRGDQERARDLLFTLARASARTVRQELDRIKDAVAHANIEFLSSLNLDQPAQTHLPHAPEARPDPTLPPVQPALPVNAQQTNPADGKTLSTDKPSE